MELRVPDRYHRVLRESDFRALVDEIARLLERAKQEGPDLLRRSRKPVADGYPTSRVAGAGGTVSELTSVEAAVVARSLVDPVRDSAAEMCQSLLVMRDAGQAALGAWGRTVLTDKPCWKCQADRLPTDEWCRQCGAGEEPSCIVCARYGLRKAVRAKDRCRSCNDWRAEHLRTTGEIADPTEEDIRDREDRRIQRELGRAA